MATAELCHTQRQIAIGFQTLIEDLNMARAVHRLNAIFTVLGRRRKHRIFIVVPVAGFFPQHTVHHERPFDFLVLVFFQLGTHKSFQFTENGPAVIMPEYHTRRFFLHMIQVELFTNFTVIAFRRFFKALQISVERFFIRPRRTVNTLQHFIVAVAAPVSPCRFH